MPNSVRCYSGSILTICSKYALPWIILYPKFPYKELIFISDFSFWVFVFVVNLIDSVEGINICIYICMYKQTHKCCHECVGVLMYE